MSFFQDLRYAVRLLLKDRWFTAIAAVVLALGIGANNAVFTIVNAVMLRSMPFPKSEQLVVMLTRDVRGQQSGVSLPDFEDWRSSARTLSGMTEPSTMRSPLVPRTRQSGPTTASSSSSLPMRQLLLMCWPVMTVRST